MSEPLSDEELREVRERLQKATADAAAGNSTVYVDEFVYLDMPKLLAEVDRLRAENGLWRIDAMEMREDLLEARAQVAAERNDRITLENANRNIADKWNKAQAIEAVNAAMRPIVEAVARFDDTNTDDGAYSCHWCGSMYDGVGDAETDHLSTCPIVAARALLAKEPGRLTDSEGRSYSIEDAHRDALKGLQALSRPGVTLTEDQQRMIREAKEGE